MGSVSVAILVFVAAVVAAAVWVAGHEDRVRHAARLVASTSPARRLRAVLARAGYPARLARRMPIQRAVLVTLLAGLALLSGLSVLFVYLLDGALDGEGSAQIDQPVTRWVAAHRDGWLTATMRVLTVGGSTVTIAVVAAVIGACASLRTRTWRPFVLSAIGAAGIGLAVALAKPLVGRPRPPRLDAVITASGYSFPSGHAAGVSAVGLLSAWILSRWVIETWRGRVVLWAAALAVVALIGFSRIYLGVHYVSDVAAGWTLGALWFGVLVLATLLSTTQVRGHRTDDPL